MPRSRRRALPGPYFHVLNRSVRKAPLFLRSTDYRAFMSVLAQGLGRYQVRLFAYCVLSNHWHLIVQPTRSDELIRFMQWVTATHAIRWHRHHRSTGQGPVYQGRFHSQSIESGAGLVRACRYVERNALRAGLVARAEAWPWCSLTERLREHPTIALSPAPFLSSPAWVDYVNQPIYAGESWETGQPQTSGTETAKSVENSSDPLDTVT
jgi:putative transposase